MGTVCEIAIIVFTAILAIYTARRDRTLRERITIISLAVFIAISSIGNIYSQHKASERNAALSKRNAAVGQRTYLAAIGCSESDIDSLGADPLIKHRLKECKNLMEFNKPADAIRKLSEELSVVDIQPETEAEIHMMLAGAWDQCYETEKARRCLDKALKVSRRIESKTIQMRYRSRYLNMMGLLEYYVGENDKSIKLLNQAIAVRRQLNDREGTANSLNNLGVMLRELSRYEESIKCYGEAGVIYIEMKDDGGLADVYGNLGIILGDIYRYEEAIQYHQRAAAMHEKAGNKKELAGDIGNIGIELMNLERMQEAIEMLERSLALFIESNDKLGIARQMASLGIAYMRLGEYDNAIEHYRKALDNFREIGNEEEVESIERSIIEASECKDLMQRGGTSIDAEGESSGAKGGGIVKGNKEEKGP